MVDSTKISWWSGPHGLSADARDEFETELAAVRELMQKLPNDEASERRSEELIRHYLRLTDAIDSRRLSLYRIALQMIAISFAGFALVATAMAQDLNPYGVGLAVAVLLALLGTTVTGLLVIITYHTQTSPSESIYHFRNFEGEAAELIVNSPRWFYHGLPALADYPFTGTRSEAVDSLAVTAFVRGAKQFLQSPGHSDRAAAIRDNLRHAYLLLVHNAYKNKFDRTLILQVRCGIITSITAFVATLFGLLLRVLLF